MKKCMKYLFSIVMLFHGLSYGYEIESVNYAPTMESYIHAWESNCINHLTHEEIITITEIIILSYEIFQASIIMAQTKLNIQLELFTIATLSINDSFDMILQVQNNDLTKIKSYLETIEKSQEKIKKTCDIFKNFGPLLVNIHPITIQTFIENLKNIIFDWIPSQDQMIKNFKSLQESLLEKTILLNSIEDIFTTITHTYPKDLKLILEGTNILSENYKNIEQEFADFTKIRKLGIDHINTLLTLFFKYHYEILYNHIQKHQSENIILSANAIYKFPEPHQLFSEA